MLGWEDREHVLYVLGVWLSTPATFACIMNIHDRCTGRTQDMSLPYPSNGWRPCECQHHRQKEAA